MAPPCSSKPAAATAAEHLSRGYERLTQLRALLFSASPATRNPPRVAPQAVQLLDKALRCLSAALAELQSSSPPGCTAADAGNQNDEPASKRRRRLDSSWTIITTVPHFDGHQWRKYGQKDINGAQFPRTYYKCTNSRDQRCPARKTVQEKGDGSENPPKFEVSYSKLHTCKTEQVERPGEQNQPFVMDSSAANSAISNFAASPAPSHDEQQLGNLEVAELDDQHLIDEMIFELRDEKAMNDFAEMNMLSPWAAFHGFAWEELLS